MNFVIMWRFYEKTGRPGWWLLLMLVPILNIIVSAVVAIDIASAFRRSAAFGVIALFLFSVIGYAMLAFGDETYTQPVNA